MTQRIFAQDAMLPGGWARDVAIDIDDAGTIVAVAPGSEPGDAERVRGPLLPAMPNVHHTLAARHAVLTLRGDDAVECSLLEGAVRIFNVMVRSPRPAAVAVVGVGDVDVAADGVAVGYAARGTLAVMARAGRLVVKPGDAFIHATGMPFTVRPIGDALGVIAMIPGRRA